MKKPKSENSLVYICPESSTNLYVHEFGFWSQLPSPDLLDMRRQGGLPLSGDLCKNDLSSPPSLPEIAVNMAGVQPVMDIFYTRMVANQKSDHIAGCNAAPFKQPVRRQHL
jgi:hypothetical protein